MTDCRFSRLLAKLETPLLLAVPTVMAAALLSGVEQAALAMLVVVALVLALFFAGYEASRPGLRQIMPTLVLAALAAAGMVPAPGAMQQFYVLLPYAGALVAGISAVWALARMSCGGARLRSYVYEETVAKLPLRCLLTGVFAALAAVGECMDVFLNGEQGAIWYAVLFAALAAAPVFHSVSCYQRRRRGGGLCRKGCGCCGCFCRRAHHPGGGLYRRIRLRARRVKDLAP